MADDVLNLAGRFHSTADGNKALDAIEVFDSTRDDKRQKHFNDDIVRLDEQINNTDGLKDRLEAVEDMASIQVDGGDVQIASTITPSTEGGKIPTVDAVKGHATAKSTFTTGESVDSIGIDSEPTAESDKLVKSGGITDMYGSYTENPEYIYVQTDSENKILYGVKANGEFFFGAGCPKQVKDYVEEKISPFSPDEYEDIVTFLNDYLGSDTTLKVMIDEINAQIADKLDAEGLDPDALETVQTVENPEWLQVTTDSEGKLIEGIDKNGEKQLTNVPEIIESFVQDSIYKYGKDSDNVVNRNISKEAAVIQAFYHGRQNPKAKNLAFVWGSDFHGSEKSLRNMFLFGEHYSNILFSLNTGDTQAASPLDADIIAPAAEGILKPILNVIGNHDNGFGSHIDKVGSAEYKYNRFIAPYLRHARVVQPQDLSDYPCYYYKDFDDYGIRLLVIDIYGAPKFTYDGGTKVANQDLPCITKKQADFICDAFLNLPENYGIIIAMHAIDSLPSECIDNNFTDKAMLVPNPNIDCGIAMDAPIISDIVGAFVNKSTLTKTYTFTDSVYDALADNDEDTSFEIDVDFSSRTTSEFICYLLGHQHKDIVVKQPNNLLGVYVINGGYGERDQSFSDIARQSTGLTQDCFNVVSIDRENKEISLVRIGADVTLDFIKRDFIKLEY